MAKRKVGLRFETDVYLLCKSMFGELTDSNRANQYTPKGAIIVIARELKMSISDVGHCVGTRLVPDMVEISLKLDSMISRHVVTERQLELPFN